MATAALVVSAVAAVVGGGISAYGMIQQGKAQQQAAEYQAKTDENNAISKGYAAASAIEDSRREADQIAANRRRILATNETAAGASGITLSGSFVDSQIDTATQMENDIAMAKYRGQVAAYNYRQESADLFSQAKFSRAAGKNAMNSAKLGATATVFQTISSVAGSVAAAKGGKGGAAAKGGKGGK